MKVVLGAAGFIGFHLTAHLAKESNGSKILAIDNFDATLYSPEIKYLRANELGKLGVEVVHSRDETFSWLDNLNENSVIFNLAAVAGLTPSWSNPSIYIKHNTEFVAQLLSTLASRQLTPTFIQASTSSVYGEIVRGDVRSNPVPSSPYGVSKLAAENLLRTFHSEFGIRARILRLFSVYGPHQRPDQFFNIALKKIQNGEKIQIYGDGSNSRSNVYVDDVVRALVLASESNADFLTVDIAGSEQINVIDVVESLSQLMGIKPNIEFDERRPGDQKETIGDLSYTLRSLNWFPETEFSKGVSNLVSHFQQYPEFY